MLDKNILSLLGKIKPIRPAELSNFRFTLFGCGGFAKTIFDDFTDNIVGLIEYPDTVEKMPEGMWGKNWRFPDSANDIVVLGTSNGTYQFNQIKALAKVSERNIENILIVDPHMDIRNIVQKPKCDSLLLLEHANGVVRHANHLENLKRYFSNNGKVITSLCPLTLHYYKDYWNCRDVLIFGGQRDLYNVAYEVFHDRQITYLEYGFFPQSKFFYLDKCGVSQDSSLMNDNLDWVGNSHQKKLGEIKKIFLNGFEHHSSNYVLVPLQVPDDPNVSRCTRFKSGMQEFIDYIVAKYPANQKIVFKAHPKDPNRNQYEYRGNQHSSAPFLKLLENASSVHGLTSSTLYEAALAGIDVITEGISILAKHQHQKNKLFAAMVDRQTPISATKLDYWIDNYSYIKK